MSRLNTFAFLVEEYRDVYQKLERQNSSLLIQSRDDYVYLNIKKTLLEEELMSLMGVNDVLSLQSLCLQGVEGVILGAQGEMKTVM